MPTIVPTLNEGDNLTEDFTLKVKAAVDELQAGALRPDLPFCLVAQDSQVFNDNVAAPMAWDAPAAADDVAGWWAAGNPTRVTPKLAGLYLVVFGSRLVAAQTTVVAVSDYILKNGGEQFFGGVSQSGIVGSTVGRLSGSGLYRANGTTDWFGLQLLYDDSGGTNRAIMAQMGVIRVGA